MITRIFRVLCEPAFRFRSTPSVYEETEEPTRSVPPENASGRCRLIFHSTTPRPLRCWPSGSPSRTSELFPLGAETFLVLLCFGLRGKCWSVHHSGSLPSVFPPVFLLPFSFLSKCESPEEAFRK